MQSLQIPFLRKENYSGAAVQVSPGTIDIGQLHFEPYTVFHSVVNDLAKPRNPQRKIVTSRHEVQIIDFQVKIAVSRSNFRNIQAVMPGTRVGNQCPHVREQPKPKTRVRDGVLGVIVEAQTNTVAAS